MCIGVLILGLYFPQVAGADDTERAGYYMPVNPPPGFADLQWIALIDKRFVPSGSPKGLIRIGTEERWRDFPFRSVSLKGDDITFTTASVNGESFGFRGRFIAKPQPIENDSDRDRIILVGTLTRNRGGTVVSASKLRFAYTPGD
ncbi:MAG: hypothetical protein AUH29_12480 [Candidatus Rokubacteria bacterium 13_1_40CM_69_27]|nr:MAG: hypothetical protein AUH29_12480 [Candidatus Rokubacteria bacterium 13_1_40CM_69_27]